MGILKSLYHSLYSICMMQNLGRGFLLHEGFPVLEKVLKVAAVI